MPQINKSRENLEIRQREKFGSTNSMKGKEEKRKLPMKRPVGRRGVVTHL